MALRGENFRWADLVSGNLKEEKDAHSTYTAAIEWPYASTAQLVVSIRHRADPALQSPGSVAHLWRVTSTNGNPTTATAHQRYLISVPLDLDPSAREVCTEGHTDWQVCDSADNKLRVTSILYARFARLLADFSGTASKARLILHIVQGWCPSATHPSLPIVSGSSANLN